MPKICLITCYDQPDYIRAKTLRTALVAIDGVELVIIKNRHKGLLRYPEVMAKLVVARLVHRPDLYFLTFRGYEMLPFVRLLSLGKPLVFDEFINLVEWVVYEHHQLKPDRLLAKILSGVYRFWLKSTDLITTDSASHAKYSAQLMRLPLDKYVSLIVSTDEATFNPSSPVAKRSKPSFGVFYYGLKMLPLHGLSTLIEAMLLLKDRDIELTLIGGKAETKLLVEAAIRGGAKIDYRNYVPFGDFPGYFKAADICLAGPLGDTVQSQFVVTGKASQFMRMGCPVIVGRNQESDLWTDHQDALIVPQANPQALAKAIIWAQTHPAELVKIGRAGQELYQAKLSNRVLTAELKRLLASKRIA